MLEKKKRMAEEEVSKKQEAEQIQTNMRIALEKEQAREHETVERSKKI